MLAAAAIADEAGHDATSFQEPTPAGQFLATA
jgi:hypothetical protein